MNVIDLAFKISADQPIRVDHGYALFAALSKLSRRFHDAERIGVHSIKGQQIRGRRVRLTEFSRLTIRTPANLIPGWLGIVGDTLCVGDSEIRVCAPELQPIEARSSLYCRLVTIKNGIEKHRFTSELCRQFSSISCAMLPEFAIGKRRTVRIRGKEVVGYEVIAEGLTAQDSISLQEFGLGGRRHMGCGIFLPLTRKHI